MKARFLFVALAATFFVSAHAQYASPEVMLVADQGTGATPVCKIDRYDPVSGQYLGSFGQGWLKHPTGVKVVGFDCYVCDANNTFTAVEKFNWATGAFEGLVVQDTGPVQWVDTALFGTGILALQGGLIGSYNASTGVQIGGYTNLPNAPAQSMTVFNGNLYIAVSNVSGGIQRYGLNPNGSLGAGSTFSSSARSAVAGYTNRYGFDEIFSTSTTNLAITVGSPASPFGGTIFTTSGTGFYSHLDFGHAGALYAMSGNRVDRWFAEEMYMLSVGSFNLSQTVTPGGMAVYAAPEPASMAALAAGALCLIRRRRAR